MPLKTRYKNLFISIFLSIISIFNTHEAFSQIFSNSQNPLSVKWRSISSSGFKIIYPSDLETQAQRMANTLPYLYKFAGSGLNLNHAEIPIILQNQGVVANGFVQLGPKKSEFYTTPPQYFDSQDWLNNLAVHEIRHVAQFAKLTGIKKHPFPELVYFAYFGAAIPLWFFEGDAVVNETALTYTGRGRQPNWMMPFRTSVLEGRKFNYSEAYFGSERKATPGYYQTGYAMVSNLRTEEGKFISDSLLTRIKKNPFIPYPFSKSLKHFTGKNTKQFFLTTQDLITKKWAEQEQKTPTKDYQVLNPKAKFETNYFLPVRINEKQILALKNSKAKTNYFVLIKDDKTAQKLFAIGQQEQPWFSYSNGVLVWNETHDDPRYKQRSYSVIYRYNFARNTSKQLSKKSRLFSPSLSADGKKIVAVKVTLDNKFNLIEMDAQNGRILKSYPNLQNYILQTPAFNGSGNAITYISVSEKGKNLCVLKKGEETILIKDSRQQLSKPIFNGDDICFNAHFNGIDNIYNFSVAEKKITALSASKYGAFNPAFGKNGEMVFNDYGINGYQIAEIVPKATKIGTDNFVDFSVAAEKQENPPNIFANVPDSSFKSVSYRQAANLLNFHSVIPVIDDKYVYGLQLQSNNLLNTTDFYTAAKYHSDLKRMEYTADLSYKALYPIIGLSYSNRPQRAFYQANGQSFQGDWRENYTNLSISLPVSFSSKNNYYALSARVSTSYTQRYQLENLPSNFINMRKFPLEYSLTLNHSIAIAPRDISPKWAQVLRFTYNHQPFDAHLKGELLALETYFYFPGLAKNHSFLASFNYQSAIGANRFAVEIPTVYGYNNILATSKLKNTVLLNYRFPIAYPDWEIGPLAYVRSFTGGLFCHYENVEKIDNFNRPKTFGLEFNTNLNLLRYLPVVNIGTRLIFVNQMYHQNPLVEFSFNYNL
ncbi:hypothetical protein ABIB40_003788 [Pedobacter sp. UYP30]|uniref:hypothetical protein n=1 Tax=Pedobacter sp. UYP30 TaxID=1756400 RepID=UPI00339858F9